MAREQGSRGESASSVVGVALDTPPDAGGRHFAEPAQTCTRPSASRALPLGAHDGGLGIPPCTTPVCREACPSGSRQGGASWSIMERVSAQLIFVDCILGVWVLLDTPGPREKGLWVPKSKGNSFSLKCSDSP